MSAPQPATPRPCNCGNHCAHCGRHYDRSRVFGWSGSYCQPLCEKAAQAASAEAFAAWWNRKR